MVIQNYVEDSNMNTNEVLNKLKAEIERRRVLFEYNGKTPDERTWRCLGELIFFIDSLQQEQPDCHTVEDWIQHIKNADQLTKDIFSKGPYDVLYDALNHPYQHCYDAIKEFGELCFQTGANSVKQEQPEVDLEKIIEQTYHDGSVADTNDMDHVTYENIARHFYELGKNSK